MCIFKKKRRELDLIDLDEYWSKLERQKERGCKTLQPPHSIPGFRDGYQWNDAEIGIMDDNRKRAKKIHKIVSQK